MYGNVILVTVLKRLNYALALLLICLQLCQHALVYKSPLANPILYLDLVPPIFIIYKRQLD